MPCVAAEQIRYKPKYKIQHSSERSVHCQEVKDDSSGFNNEKVKSEGNHGLISNICSLEKHFMERLDHALHHSFNFGIAVGSISIGKKI